MNEIKDPVQKTLAEVEAEKDKLCGEIQALINCFNRNNPELSLEFEIKDVTKEIHDGRKLRLPPSVKAKIIF